MLSIGAGSLEVALSPEVDWVGFRVGELVEEAEAKKMVREAGPSCSVLRETVMGIAGLWYFRRGR